MLLLAATHHEQIAHGDRHDSEHSVELGAGLSGSGLASLRYRAMYGLRLMTHKLAWW
jgi:hypothetical protein